MPDDTFLEIAKRQLMQASGISVSGINELMQKRIITHPKDREALTNYLLWVQGRLTTCSSSKPVNTSHSQ